MTALKDDRPDTSGRLRAARDALQLLAVIPPAWALLPAAALGMGAAVAPRFAAGVALSAMLTQVVYKLGRRLGGGPR